MSILSIYLKNIFNLRRDSPILRVFSEPPSFVDLKLEHDKFQRMFPRKNPKIRKKDNDSVMSITAGILNRLEFGDANQRLSTRNRETLPRLEPSQKRRRKQPRKALNQLDCNSILMLENINRIRLERMRKSILSKKAFDPGVTCKAVDGYVFEVSEMLVNYLSLEDHRAGSKASGFRKCFDQRELKEFKKNHFAMRSRHRVKRRSKSLDLARPRQKEFSSEQLFYVLAQNPNNSLRPQKNTRNTNQLLQKIHQKNPTLMYNRFSQNLIKFLKLNIGKKLTGQVSTEDLVVRVSNAFEFQKEETRGIVVGK